MRAASQFLYFWIQIISDNSSSVNKHGYFGYTDVLQQYFINNSSVSTHPQKQP